ncbi:hypothetical protein [Streptomyces sp. URMC 123]|uniref:hypothetical protein n=1 Tax=Streptomyces sp. URMC 123 TaxID=3423403 RepID=UPI003F1CA243
MGSDGGTAEHRRPEDVPDSSAIGSRDSVTGRPGAAQAQAGQARADRQAPADQHQRQADHQRAAAGGGSAITLDSRELAALLLEMGRAATSGELGVYRREELEEAREEGYAQGWQDAMNHLAEQESGDSRPSTLADVIALIDSPLPGPRASELRSQEPLMPHRKRKPGERSG